MVGFVCSFFVCNNCLGQSISKCRCGVLVRGFWFLLLIKLSMGMESKRFGLAVEQWSNISCCHIQIVGNRVRRWTIDHPK